MCVADQKSSGVESGGQIGWGDTVYTEVDQPCHPLAWRQQPHPIHRGQSIIAVVSERGDALVDPLPADLLGDPIQAYLQPFEPTRIAKGNLIALTTAGWHVVAIVIAHSRLYAKVAHKRLLNIAPAFLAHEQGACAIGAAEPLLPGTGVRVHA